MLNRIYLAECRHPKPCDVTTATWCVALELTHPPINQFYEPQREKKPLPAQNKLITPGLVYQALLWGKNLFLPLPFPSFDLVHMQLIWLFQYRWTAVYPNSFYPGSWITRKAYFPVTLVLVSNCLCHLHHAYLKIAQNVRVYSTLNSDPQFFPLNSMNSISEWLVRICFQYRRFSWQLVHGILRLKLIDISSFLQLFLLDLKDSISGRILSRRNPTWMQMESLRLVEGNARFTGILFPSPSSSSRLSLLSSRG